MCFEKSGHIVMPILIPTPAATTSNSSLYITNLNLPHSFHAGVRRHSIASSTLTGQDDTSLAPTVNIDYLSTPMSPSKLAPPSSPGIHSLMSCYSELAKLQHKDSTESFQSYASSESV